MSFTFLSDLRQYSKGFTADLRESGLKISTELEREEESEASFGIFSLLSSSPPSSVKRIGCQPVKKPVRLKASRKGQSSGQARAFDTIRKQSR